MVFSTINDTHEQGDADYKCTLDKTFVTASQSGNQIQISKAEGWESDIRTY